MDLRIDRNLPISLSDQIKGQIAYAIMVGTLRSGDSLPSVRDLSDALQASPTIVARAYRELSWERLIVTKPGLGTFVGDIVQTDAHRGFQAVLRNLREIADIYVRQALSLGYTIEEIRDATLARLAHYDADDSVRRVALVGNFPAATEAYARDIETILHDLNVRVEPLMISDLEANPNQVADLINGVKLVITIPTRLEAVRRLLEPFGYGVVAVAFRVSTQTRQSLSAIAPNLRLGAVSYYPEFLQSLLDGLSSYCLSHAPPMGAILDQEDRVKDMMRQTDVLVYASGSERILQWLPENVAAIEYRHTPEPDSVNRLRPLIA